MTSISRSGKVLPLLIHIYLIAIRGMRNRYVADTVDVGFQWSASVLSIFTSTY